MAPPSNAWRTQHINRNYRPLSAASLRANDGFGGAPRGPPSKRHLQRRATQFCHLKRQRGPLQGKLRNKGMLAAAGALPIMAGLGALIGGLVNKKKEMQEGSGAWRVSAHQPFLLNLVGGDGTTWCREINRASNEQIRALTDVIRNLYDGVVPLPTQVKLPSKKHIREIQRLSGLKTPLYERRALPLALGSRLLPFVRLGLRA